jgi:hypothetical protein
VQVTSIDPTPFQGNLDLSFLLDCTGSMDSYIQGMKVSIIKVIDEMRNVARQNQRSRAVIRTQFMGYRDFGDTNRFSHTPFTTDADTLRTAISSQDASGGGDGPEDIPGALDRVLADIPEASCACQIAVLVADAGGHGASQYSSSPDHAAFDPADRIPWDQRYAAIASRIAERDVTLLIVPVSGNDVLHVFQKLSDHLPAAKKDLVRQSTLTNAQQFMKVIADLVGKSYESYLKNL